MRHFTTEEIFLDASKYLQSIYTLDEIHRLWNKSRKGNPANLATVKRWLNKGPTTKNPRFEPFIIQLANDEWNKREVNNSSFVPDVTPVTIEDVIRTYEKLGQQIQNLRSVA